LYRQPDTIEAANCSTDALVSSADANDDSVVAPTVSALDFSEYAQPAIIAATSWALKISSHGGYASFTHFEN
jgi:hypothetical protein